MTNFPSTCALVVLILLGSSSANLAAQARENICSVVDCMQGKCKVSENASILGFDCECFPGWTKFHIGLLIFPICNVPNCTVSMNCGSKVSPFPSLPTFPVNVSDPCTMAWCGDGNCTAGGGTDHVCHCNPGSSNFGGNDSFPCFQNCSLGGDCQGIKIDPSSEPPTPTNSDSNPSTQTPPPASNGSNIKMVGNEPGAAMMIKAVVLASTTLLVNFMFGTLK